MIQHEYQKKNLSRWHYVYRKTGTTQRFNIEDIKQSSQIRLVEVKETTYGEAL